jgi:hypothetical protein
MHMNDLNRFNIPKNFIIDWDHVERMLRESPSPSDRVLLERFFPKTGAGGAGGSTTATSTAYDVKQNPKAREQWWVKVPNEPRLQLVTIASISGASVAVRVNGTTPGGLRDGRYERDYFKFVEQHDPSLEPKSV